MKRPMLVIGVSFSVAMWAAFYFALPPQHCPLIAAVLSLLAFACNYRLRGRYSRHIAAVLLSAGISSICFFCYNIVYIAPFSELAGEYIPVSGMITDSRPSSGQATRYTLLASFPQSGLPDAQIYVYQFGEIEFAPGDVIFGEMRPMNPKTPQAARSMQRAGVVLTGSLINASHSTGENLTAAQWLFHLRQSLCSRLFRVMPQHIAEFEQGVIFGQVSEIPPDVYLAMQRSGTLHLLAVSGYHLTVLSGLAFAVLGYFRAPRRLKNMVAWLLCFGFVALTGFSPSLLRSFIMISVIILAGTISRRADTLNSIGISLLIITALRPGWILGFGLWYSVLACAGIAIVSEPTKRRLLTLLDRDSVAAQFVADSFAISFGAYLFTLPLTFIQNGWIPVFSPIANFFVGMFAPLTLIGGMLCAVLPAGFITSIIALAVSVGVSLTTGISKVFAELPFALLAFNRPWMLLIFAVLVAGFIALRRRGAVMQKHILLVCVCAALFSVGLLAEAALTKNRAELILLGDNNFPLLIRGKSAVLLAAPDQHNVGGILQYLEFRGVDELDAVLAGEHNGRLNSGIIRVYDSLPVHLLIAPTDESKMDLLAQAMPGVTVYPSENSSVSLLGGVLCSFDHNGSPILQIGGVRAFSYRGEYDTMINDTENLAGFIGIYTDFLELPAGISAGEGLIGGGIFGERRIILPL